MALISPSLHIHFHCYFYAVCQILPCKLTQLSCLAETHGTSHLLSHIQKKNIVCWFLKSALL